MGLLNLTLPSVGQPNSTEDVDIVNSFSAIQTLLNGNIDPANITAKSLTIATLLHQYAYGYVAAAGTASIAGSSDWTSARSAVGTYAITFTTAFIAAPVCILGVGGAAGTFGVKQSGAATGTTLNLLTYLTTTGALADSDFTFIALGRR